MINIVTESAIIMQRIVNVATRHCSDSFLLSIITLRAFTHLIDLCTEQACLTKPPASEIIDKSLHLFPGFFKAGSIKSLVLTRWKNRSAMIAIIWKQHFGDRSESCDHMETTPQRL